MFFGNVGSFLVSYHRNSVKTRVNVLRVVSLVCLVSQTICKHILYAPRSLYCIPAKYKGNRGMKKPLRPFLKLDFNCNCFAMDWPRTKRNLWKVLIRSYDEMEHWLDTSNTTPHTTYLLFDRASYEPDKDLNLQRIYITTVFGATWKHLRTACRFRFYTCNFRMPHGRFSFLWFWTWKPRCGERAKNV